MASPSSRARIAREREARILAREERKRRDFAWLARPVARKRDGKCEHGAARRDALLQRGAEILFANPKTRIPTGPKSLARFEARALRVASYHPAAAFARPRSAGIQRMVK